MLRVQLHLFLPKRWPCTLPAIVTGRTITGYICAKHNNMDAKTYKE